VPIEIGTLAGRPGWAELLTRGESIIRAAAA
jgi:hypothetical protein